MAKAVAKTSIARTERERARMELYEDSLVRANSKGKFKGKVKGKSNGKDKGKEKNKGKSKERGRGGAEEAAGRTKEG